MKRLSLIVLTLTLLSQAAFARNEDRQYDPDYLKQRRTTFGKMQTGGFVMGGLGLAMTVGGIILASNGEWETVETANGGTQSQAQDGSAVGGILLLATGIPMGVVGFILGGIGTKKVHQYDRMLQGVSLQMEYGKSRQGMRLSYAF